MIDYINGNKFADSCDFVIYPNDYKMFTEDMSKKNAVIFCRPDFLNYVFTNLRNSFHKYILVTHCSDFPIDFNRFSMKPSSVKKWFAQNAAYDHKDLISIPIGLENTITENGAVKGGSTDPLWLVENIERLKDKDKITDTLYCAWRKETNPGRGMIIDKLKNNAVKYVLYEKLGFHEHMERSSDFKFIVSPPGNGVDCHRTWEILYTGGIPIVMRNRIYEKYNLPILQVNDYDEVSEDLIKEYLEFYKSHEFDYKQLEFSYWKKLIRDSFKDL